jgi:hypothetical protein
LGYKAISNIQKDSFGLIALAEAGGNLPSEGAGDIAVVPPAPEEMS